MDDSVKFYCYVLVIIKPLKSTNEVEISMVGATTMAYIQKKRKY